MILLALLLACAETPAPPATPVPPVPPAADPHAGHHAGGSDHMKQMAATREGLRAKLGESYDQPVPGLDAADLSRGKALYDAHCASCHGAGGKGDGEAGKGLNPPPGDLTDAFHARFYSDAGRVHIIREGSPGTAMAAFAGTLSDAEVLEVYAYTRTLRGDVPGAHDHAAHGH